jgi:TonB family protein
MRLFIYTFIALFSFAIVNAQDLVRYNPVKAEIRGGTAELVQVLQTQLSLPKNFSQSNFDETITIYFLLDSLNRPIKGLCKPGISPAANRELIRILNFMSYRRPEVDPQVPYFITLPLSAAKYNSYFKQKQKNNLKTTVSADSSMQVMSRSDKSPDFFKNGEEGLKDYLMSEIEYPKLAIEKSVEGTVIVEFIVETNGYVTNVSIKQGLGAGCSEEAIRLMQRTRWQPAVQNGKLVRYKMTYPITFSLRNTTKEGGFSN